MAGATTAMMTQDAGSHLLATPNGTNGLPNASMPILQPVFIPRQTASKNSQQPVSPNGLGATASADWAFLLRSAAALSTAGNLAPTLDVVGSSPSMPDLAAGMRSSPQVQSSPSLLYSPITSTGPNSNFFSDNFAAVGHDTLAAQAAATDPNGFGMVSNGNNLASTLSAAAAMYGDNAGVQTLYSSSDQLAMAANAQAAAARQAAQQTQNILQQAAVNSLSNGLNGLNLAGLAGLGNGLGKLEESLSGSLFGAAGAPKPVSSSLYIKNLPPDADKLFLYEKFSPYGAILSVKVLNDPQSGQCRGVGFVNFAEHASAVRSIQALHGTKVGDKLMHVSLQTPRIRASAMQCQ